MDGKSAWVGKSTKVDKPWGYEIRWGVQHNLQGKEMHISKGHRTSLKYHTTKDEVLFLVSGRAIVEYAGEDWKKYDDTTLSENIMIPGQYLAVQSGCLYRINAETDCVFFEISNRSTGKSVMLEDDYGRK